MVVTGELLNQLIIIFYNFLLKSAFFRTLRLREKKEQHRIEVIFQHWHL